MDAVRVAYIGGFTFAAVACLLSLRRVSRVSDPDTQRGLRALLGLSGLWAITHVGRLLPISPAGQLGFYVTGLVVGLATIGAWLYFCSAYTGHDHHRQPWIRRAALGLYVAIITIKITNPLHGLYFETTTTTQPFPHVVIELSTIHWIVTGLSYALAAIGFYLLYEMLSRSKSDVRMLGALMATTALPIVFYLATLVDTGGLVTLHYEPLGVAVFAVGALYFVDEQFTAIPRFWRAQILDEINEAIVVTDGAGRLRDYNRRALEIFPELRGREDTPLTDVVSSLACAAEEGGEIITVGQPDDETERYLYVTKTPLTQVDVVVGQAVVCADVTDLERQRRQLERKNEQLDRQNEQLDAFADAITHELRNTLTIAIGYFGMIAEERPEDSSDEAVETVKETHERMERIVSDLARLARRGQTIDEMEACELSSVAAAAFSDVDTDGLSLRNCEDISLRADQSLLLELLSTVVRFADLHGASELAVESDGTIITLTTDGEPIPAETIEDVFAYGEAKPSAETGMLFPTMRAIASSHGWTVEIDPTYRDGVRIEIGGVELLPATG
ncbi:histidine kinase N-terminal 7TM domain-containing protein [Halosegnis longus]|uniref:histidine kinase N-terminal 7TM domain-containing protein n=1 Tax=Halosegnis longus TaxID=2216012 RepID=UPI0009AD8194|nr:MULTISPECIES: histidine kinase N-terminal 7TM domain-containing protein [Halobacteriales]